MQSETLKQRMFCQNKGIKSFIKNKWQAKPQNYLFTRVQHQVLNIFQDIQEKVACEKLKLHFFFLLS